MTEIDAPRPPTVAILLLTAAACALLLALPGRTVTTVYVNDLFIFLDGAHRVVSGQVPNRDFHTALGPLVYYLPALGQWLTGSLGSAIPVGVAVLLAALAPVTAHVLGTRLRPALAIPFGIFVLLVMAVPMNLGESIGSLSFAMYYNRIGWAALALLLVMYAPPVRPGRAQVWLDALSAGSLAALMLYTKVTYGVVALAFLAFMVTDRAQRRWALGGLALVLLTGVLVELVWRSTLAHVSDLLLTSRVSGARGLVDWVLGFLRHLADYVLFGIVAALTLWLRRSWRDLVFFGFCGGVGLLIMAQNSQPWGILTLHAGAAAGAELLMRAFALHRQTWSLARGAPALVLALVLPTAVHCLLALLLHARLAFGRAGAPFGLPGYAGVHLAELWSPGDRAFSTAYLASVRDGATLLEGLPQARRVSVLDFANPYSAGLGLVPARGDNAWLHWGRNVDEEHHLSGEQLLGGVEFLMEPKWGINNIPLHNLYGDYIRAAFEPIRESEFWIVHRRRAASIPPGRTAEPAQTEPVTGGGRP